MLIRVLVSLLVLLSLPVYAVTQLTVNRQSQENAVGIETDLFGSVQIQLINTKTGALLADTVLEGPGIFSIGNLPPDSLNHLTLQAVPGRPSKVDNYIYRLPLSENADWRISQGFHGQASHHDDLNEYAVDFDLLLGTPVLAARTGIVMEVIDDFPDNSGTRHSGLEQANIIRIQHDDGSMAVYGHLLQNSAVVIPGQWVVAGAVLGQSGNSGYTHGPHLHFVLQVNTGMQLRSVPFTMKDAHGLISLEP